jgi:pyridoxal phosphate enzyme (YggS family)
VQEIEQKVPLLKGTFEMHLIGHLQTNKVNKVAQLTNWIQSIDSIRLAEKLNTAAEHFQKRINVMVQVNTSHEETKSGCDESECIALATQVAECSHLDFRGLMTIGPLGASEVDTRKSFAVLRNLSERCAQLSSSKIELSMGMSSDFEWAIAEGATMIRVGTMLLGERDYPN